jgi:hypothetical protein
MEVSKYFFILLKKYKKQTALVKELVAGMDVSRILDTK